MASDDARAGNMLSDLSARAAKLKGTSGWRRLLLAFVAGAVTALSLAPFYILPALAIGFSILIILLDGAKENTKPQRVAFLIGWFFGFGYFLVGIYWMAFSFFVQADQFAWMAPFAVLGMPSFLAIFTGAACVLCIRLWHAGWSRIFLFAAVWVLFEYVRGHILTGLPWNLIGQSLAGSAIGAQTAAWYGVYGLSLIGVFLASAPAATIHDLANGAKRMFGVAIMAIGVVVLLAVGAIRLSLPEPATDNLNVVRVVQPNIPQREKIDPDLWGQNFRKQLDLSLGDGPDGARMFILWPENGAPLLSEATAALRILTEELPDNSVLLAGAIRRQPDEAGVMRYYNSIAIVPETPAGRQVVAHYDKHHLVPFGEYLPLYDLMRAVGLAQLTPYGDSGFTAGSGPTVMNAGGPSFAPLICYEVIFPGALYPRGERPQWLMTVTNDAWFGDTSGPRQHLDMARLRAVESGLPMVRSANTGISAVFDGKGRLIDRISLYSPGRIDAFLPPAMPRTLYDRLGDWPYLAATALFLGLSASSRRRVARP